LWARRKKEEHSRHELFVVPEKFNRKKPVYISEENYNQFKFMGCCHPIPGDDALGYINNKNQIEIHKRACPVADKLKTSYGNRILDIKWDMHKKLYFDATIRISGIDRLGMLSEMTQVISSEMNVNIHKILITCEEGIFEGTIEMRVHDRDNVRAIIENLKKIQDIKEISEIM
jgi:GTP pyrophosphokinase